ncbi:hypothetical protein P7K49_011141 [Saguinus oedipus]|uniref:Chemokine interleukin-8-like domain-containing protein n=1 Tax=Saguinus oedipus TaxID=9490 RepID=A0ABQ9VPT7_SAGOE|nr:hypothetical protein P7K49_011141 [Saguinus oedipus]
MEPSQSQFPQESSERMPYPLPPILQLQAAAAPPSPASESSAIMLHVFVFVTRKNRQVCANPEKKWVREYINSLEMS